MVENRAIGHGDRRGDERGRISCRFDLLQAREAPHQKARADEQHAGERHFDDDQRVAHAAAAAIDGDRARRGAHRAGQIDAAGVERRRRAEDERGRDRHGQHEEHHAPVDRDERLARQIVRRHQQLQPARHRVAGGDAERAAGQREQQTLGQELADDPRSARAERGAHHDLALAGGAARHGDIGEVRAADEQQHADRRHQHVERLAQARVDDEVREAIDGDAPVLLDVGIVVRDLRRDRLHPRARLLERHPWLHPRDDLEPVIVAGALARSEGQRTPELGAAAIESAAGRASRRSR